MRKKYIKIKNVKNEIAFFNNDKERGKKISKFQEMDKKEDTNKKTDTLTNNIKNREKVDEKILSSQKVFKQNINRKYENSQNKIKNKIEENNLYLVFVASILTIITLGWTIFYSFINNEYQNNRAKIFSMPKNFFKINLYENIMIWSFILIPPLLYMSYKKVKGIKIPFYFFNVFMELLFTIVNMALWSDKLDSFFSKYSLYNEKPELFTYIFLLFFAIFFIVINLIVLKEKKDKEINYSACLGYLYSSSKNLKKRNKERWKIYIFIILYVGILGLAYYGRAKPYESVVVEEQEVNGEKIKVIIGEYEGIYAIATATDDGKVIIFEKDSVELKKIEDIKKAKKMYFREEKFKQKMR
ncbi:hypothetical protein I6H56_03810 [Fusobacterium canifelinum]|uniref:Uncharacterized protein n=1 Tax=Fusobacterium canifelinum TaxID=285729 RepID=A0A7T4FQ04_9FUSO|nr:hypothetical protein [Fusobacterium canifelinum]QQB74592.1 hypothetical protein I6H56_03810 [Fusobacterium canifelinum]